MNRFDELKTLVDGSEADFSKFQDGNSAAGTRVRKVMLELRNLANTIRKEVQEEKNRRKAS
ncbi:MAG: histone H1 [Bacteroidetes bacterium]|nr:histone H1 [Bacteroidota bacterium]